MARRWFVLCTLGAVLAAAAAACSEEQLHPQPLPPDDRGEDGKNPTTSEGSNDNGGDSPAPSGGLEDADAGSDAGAGSADAESDGGDQ